MSKLKREGGRLNAPLNLHKLQKVYVDTCPRCGLCIPSCPAYEATLDSRLIPSYKIKLIRDLHPSFIRRLLRFRRSIRQEDLVRATYGCALCGRCEEFCPYGIDTVNLWKTLREAVYLAGLSPAPLKNLEDSLLSHKNPYGVEASMRTTWSELLGLDELVQQRTSRKAETVLFVGCTPSLRSVAQDILAATVLILEKAREDWTTMGVDEWCCGRPLLMIGNRDAAAKYLKHNVEAALSLGAKRLVTVCATCYKMFKLEHLELMGSPPPMEVLHVTQLLAKYLTELRLMPTRRLDVKVAYHDPCDLARAAGVMEAPRVVIREVARELVELPHNRLDTLCCGGGGLLQATDNDLRMSIAKRRLREAVEGGVDVLASACPACKSTFIEAAREEGVDIEVLDVVELVARALELSW